MKQTAIKLAKAGLSVIPCNVKTKAPTCPSWKQYQQSIPSQSFINQYFNNNTAVAIIMGAVSGNLELIDIDNHIGNADKIFEQFKNLCRKFIPNVLGRLVIEKTQSGGFHIIYKCNYLEHNQKLAIQLKNDKKHTVIETRGEGGYAIVDPSAGYKLIQNDFYSIPIINKDDRTQLIHICKSFNEIIEESNLDKEYKKQNKGSFKRPGDIYNEKANITQLLEKHGYKLVKVGSKLIFTRPGKKDGVSATFNHNNNNLFYNFSTSDPNLDPNKSYSKFALYAILEHKGDFKAATKDLAKQGYEDPNYAKQKYSDYTISETGIIVKDAGSVKENKFSFTDADLVYFNEDLNDTGNARRLEYFAQGTIKYCSHNKKWYVWNNKFWEDDTKNNVVCIAQNMLENYKYYVLNSDFLDDKEKKQIIKFINTSANQNKISAMLILAQSLPSIATNINEFDSYNNFLNLKNGVFDLTKYELIPHDPKYLLTQYIDINYNEKAEIEYWDEALIQYFATPSLIKYIQKMCGLFLTGDHLTEKLFFFYGTGKNGKTIFIRTLQMIMQSYSVSARADILIANNNNSIPADVARLNKKRLATITELPSGKRFDEEAIKYLTGGDKITARFLYGQFFDFEPTFSLIIAGNQKPSIHGAEEGIWRRFILVPFEQQIPNNILKPSKEILALLEKEKEGILNWMLQGWDLYLNEGFETPNIIKKAIEDYKDDEDILKDFFNQCIQEIPNYIIKQKDLYDAYLKFCEANNEKRPLKNKTFYQNLEARGFKRDSNFKNGRSFRGLRLSDQDNEQAF